MSPRFPSRLGAALALAVSLAGCQRIERASECRALAQVVNPVLKTIDTERRSAPASAAAYEAIGRRYDALTAAVWGLRVRSRKLVEPVGEYQKLLREGARDARAFAEVLALKDPGRVAQARAAASRTVKRELAIVARIDGACRGR